MVWTTPAAVADVLAENHYLGPIRRGTAWQDEFGVIVVSSPTARKIPSDWLELSRWCLVRHDKHDGSKQWSAFVASLKKLRPDVSTIVSYSDPSRGHTGALYRACNWWWAPTWLRLRPPPSGHGAWSPNKPQSVKDRWVFPLRRDRRRRQCLVAQDAAVLRRWPWAEYKEPGGVSYKRFVSAVGPLDERLPSRASLVQPEATAPERRAV
jgi:hypothetical protein